MLSVELLRSQLGIRVSVKNRHHYSMYVHNCKLVLLLRQEFGAEVEMQDFKPAEWRWSLPEVCDGEWHHYALSMNFPDVMMHVDGVPLGPHDKPEVIDDWALHRVSGLHSTKLFVGACWRGKEEIHAHLVLTRERATRRHFVFMQVGTSTCRSSSMASCRVCLS